MKTRYDIVGFVRTGMIVLTGLLYDEVAVLDVVFIPAVDTPSVLAPGGWLTALQPQAASDL